VASRKPFLLRYAQGITGRTEQDWTADEAGLSLRETGECDPLAPSARAADEKCAP